MLKIGKSLFLGVPKQLSAYDLVSWLRLLISNF